MPRRARQKSPYGIYHVILRGNGRRTIFEDDDDCRFFLKLLNRLKQEQGFRVYAFCLMGNHVHLLIREEETPLEQIFRRLPTIYAMHYNEKYDFSGHLFQGRYKSEIIDSEEYFLSCLRYICMNPVKAGLCGNPKEYPWLGAAGIWNHGMETDRLKELNGYNDVSFQAFLQEACAFKHIEYDDRSRMDDRRAAKLLCELTGCEKPKDIAGWNGELKTKALSYALRSGINRTQLARITGVGPRLIDTIYDTVYNEEHKCQSGIN